MKSSPEALAARLASCFDKNQGRTQAALSRFCGVSTAAVAQWVKTGGISEENLKKAAEFFSVDEKWLLEGDAVEASDAGSAAHPEAGENIAHAPVMPNGPGAIAIPECELLTFDTFNSFESFKSSSEDYKAPLDRPEWRHVTAATPIYRTAEFFRRMGVAPVRCRAMRVHGDAMAPTLMPGDRVLFELWDFPRSAQERLAQQHRIVDGALYVTLTEHTCRVKRLGKKGGAVMAFSDNPRYGEETYAQAALEGLIVCGRVIGLEREFLF